MTKMSSIKRGVSLYSLQDEYARKKLILDEMFGKLKKMGVCGIEVLSDQMIHGSPYPTESVIQAWKNRMEKYGFESVSNDIFINSTLYHNRRLTSKEQLAMLKAELINAHNLGFTLVRLVSNTNADLMEPALETAEKCNVTMALEIHGALGFDTVSTRKFTDQMIKMNSKYVGIVLDCGLFCKNHPRVARNYHMHLGLNKEVADYIDAIYTRGSDPNQFFGIENISEPKFPDDLKALFKSPIDEEYAIMAASYEDVPFSNLDSYMPYVKSIHGKCYEMTPECEEYSIRYKELIDYLKAKDWSGYICTEYEGNRFIIPSEEVDGIEQVRRHQEMLKKYIGE
jgi:sugar phosphate isomerase/epimerase